MPSAFWILTPSSAGDAQLAIAAVQAGEIGIFDLGWNRPGTAEAATIAALAEAAGSDRWGIRVEALASCSDPLSALRTLAHGAKVPLLVLAGLPDQQLSDGSRLAALRLAAGELAETVYLEIYRLAEAEAAERAGFDGLLAKGNEAAGRVGSRFVVPLAAATSRSRQHSLRHPGRHRSRHCRRRFPGRHIGRRVARASLAHPGSCFRRGPAPALGRVDGSETVTVADRTDTYRFFARVGHSALADVERLIAEGHGCGEAVETVLGRQGASSDPAAADAALVPLGQDIAFARLLAKRHQTVAGLLQAMRRRITADLELARARKASCFPAARWPRRTASNFRSCRGR